MSFERGNTGLEISSGRDDFDVNREQRQADHIRDHQQTVDQKDSSDSPSLNNGRRALSHKNPGYNLAAQKKRAENEKAVRFALKIARRAQELANLNIRLKAIDNRLEELKTEMSELDDMKERIENEEFDPNDPKNASLMKKYGITEDDINSGAWRVILAEKSEQQQTEKTDLEKERVKINERKAELQKNDEDRTHSAKVNNNVDSLEQKNWKSSDKIRASDNTQNNPERDHKINILNEIEAVDVEVGTFMKEYAEAQKIPEIGRASCRERV